MSKILVLNVFSLANRGTEAVTIGLLKSIEHSIPAANITFLCHRYNADKEEFLRIDKGSLEIQVKEHPWFKETSSGLLTAAYSGIRCLFSLSYCILCRIAYKCGLAPKNVFHDCDIIVDLNIDCLNEFYKGVFPTIFVLLNILHGIVVGKPVMVCAASVAPFKRRSLRFLVKAVLNQTKLITVRDELSREHIHDLGVDKPQVSLTADLAFLMEPAQADRVDEILAFESITVGERPLVGIAVAHKSLFAKPEDYVRLMAEFSDALILELNATLIYVSHSSFQTGPSDDDNATIQEIHQKIRAKHEVRLIQGDYMADELKGIIGRCDLFVSAKFHPLIASASMAIPSIGIVGYNQYKFHGVIGKMMGMEEYLINIDEFDNYDAIQVILTEKVRYSWENRNLISQKLAAKARTAKEQAFLNGSLIRDLVLEALTGISK